MTQDFNHEKHQMMKLHNEYWILFFCKNTRKRTVKRIKRRDNVHRKPSTAKASEMALEEQHNGKDRKRSKKQSKAKDNATKKTDIRRRRRRGKRGERGEQ